MLFNSIQFVVFFVAVTGLYFTIPHRYRATLLLVCSCYFYMAFVPAYILILAATIVLDYFLAQVIESRTGKTRRLLLIISLISNVGILATFKYYNFINENLQIALQQVGMSTPLPYLNILLPIGLSFHTFQAMSYIIEVYRGKQKPEKNLVIYALYVMFYPQLVAGPIERPQNLLHQFREVHSFNYRLATSGLKLMAWGFFKKVVIADRLALMVSYVYDSPEGHEGVAIVIATVCFAFQVYCDFSGYSDIAIGAARVMGFNLMTNFNAPYFSKSIGEFWKRWHISLSTWFKDYLYIPLGGNRVKKPRLIINIMVVFVISGLWHGANWTFIVWGALHGAFLAIENVSAPFRAKLLKGVRISENWRLLSFAETLITLVLICFAWIFFRASTIADAMHLVTHIGSGWKESIHSLFTNANFSRERNLYLGLPFIEFAVAVSSVLVLIFAEFWQQKRHVKNPLSSISNKNIRWAVYYLLLMFIMLFGVYHKPQQFIYFQF